MPAKLVNASATFPEDLLREIDERAKALDMTRSQYLRRLARNDLEQVRFSLRGKRGRKADVN